MSIISLLITVALIGFLVWLINQIPMPAQIKRIIIVIAAVMTVLWILQSFGYATNLPHIQLK